MPRPGGRQARLLSVHRVPPRLPPSPQKAALRPPRDRRRARQTGACHVAPGRHPHPHSAPHRGCGPPHTRAAHPPSRRASSRRPQVACRAMSGSGPSGRGRTYQAPAHLTGRGRHAAALGFAVRPAPSRRPSRKSHEGGADSRRFPPLHARGAVSRPSTVQERRRIPPLHTRVRIRPGYPDRALHRSRLAPPPSPGHSLLPLRRRHLRPPPARHQPPSSASAVPPTRQPARRPGRYPASPCNGARPA